MIIESQNKKLMAPVMKCEVSEALKGLGRDKAPSPDGVSGNVFSEIGVYFSKRIVGSGRGIKAGGLHS